MKAMRDRDTVQRAANSRLRKMSHKENSTMAYLPTKNRAPTHMSRRRVSIDSAKYTSVARMNASNARKVLLEIRLAA
ncbi:hypothetical protein D3C71_2050600 [compost metagenome]